MDWVKSLGVTEQELRKAVADVGGRRGDGG